MRTPDVSRQFHSDRVPACGRPLLVLIGAVLGILTVAASCRGVDIDTTDSASTSDCLVLRAVFAAPTGSPSGYRLSIWRDGRLQVRLGNNTVVYSGELNSEEMKALDSFTADDRCFVYGDSAIHARFVRFVHLDADGWLFCAELGNLDYRRDPPPQEAHERTRFLEVIRFWLFVEGLLPTDLNLDSYGPRLAGYLESE